MLNRTPPVVNRKNVIDLPPELKVKGMQVEIVMDVVFINDQSFLHTVDWMIKFCGLVHLETRKKGQGHTKEMLYEEIDAVLQHYNKYGIYVPIIHADNEFEKVGNDLLPVRMRLCGVDDHVPEIERSVQTQKTRIGPYVTQCLTSACLE